MAASDIADLHAEWIGHVQPVGLVVAPAALAKRGLVPDRNVGALQELLDGLLAEDGEHGRVLRDLPALFRDVLGWEGGDLAGAPGGPPLPEDLAVSLVEYGETLRPTYAVRSATAGPEAPWAMLVRAEPVGADLDSAADDGRGWAAAPHAKFERLLRETGIPAGLLTDGRVVRLVYAPRGETSGYATFPLAEMTEVAGRPMLSALHMLLGADLVFGAADADLNALLAESRKYQAEVSAALARQVLAALHELLRGLDVAGQRGGDGLVRDLADRRPDHLYGGLLTALMRLVFVLYAEDRGLFPQDEVWTQNYALGGLFARLRDDAALYPDTMDDRYGAYAQLVALWRLIHRGGGHGGLRLVARRGRLFDPDRYPFLEGRVEAADPVRMPRVSDGTVWRILDKLMVLKGERLSYRTLDVEQIGSVYETMMGFEAVPAEGPSLAIRSQKRGGASAIVALDALLAEPAAKRAAWLAERAGRKVTGAAEKALRDATTVAELAAALDGAADRDATPRPVPAGTPVLQPTDERRRSGSHYTPRSLTEPIVREALRPVLARLGEGPHAAAILDLEVLDLAMGSGAFLVEACRQLGDAVVAAWTRHGDPPSPLPPDEDLVLHARRLVAQHCLYGVDKNPMAVDLARLSLWLATLARDHEFTFLDHALRSGDSLVGLTRAQIGAVAWDDRPGVPLIRQLVQGRLQQAEAERRRLRETVSEATEAELRPLLDRADAHLDDVRLAGDAVVAAFFSAEKAKHREAARAAVEQALAAGGTGWQDRLRPRVAALRAGEAPVAPPSSPTGPPSSVIPAQAGIHGSAGADGAMGPGFRRDDEREMGRTTNGKPGLAPFHWEIEFPEVFGRANPGFDAIIGNPPFLGGTSISNQFGMHYFRWLTEIFPPAGHHCDLAAYFFRQGYSLLRDGGCFGLIGTNSIAQGDTRAGGLSAIAKRGGTIYYVEKRIPWPGQAAVIVSSVCVEKGDASGAPILDGRPVTVIGPYLVDAALIDEPHRLKANPFFSLGSKIYGQGFTFDDADPKANPSSLLNDIIRDAPGEMKRVFPYIGGEQVNDHPCQMYRRHVIFLSDIQDESELDEFPKLRDIVREKVYPERMVLGDNPNNIPLKRKWLAYQAHRPELYNQMKELPRVLICSQVSGHVAFAFVPTNWIIAHTACVFAISTFSMFSTTQSRCHEIWARFFASSMKDDMRYTPSDCFETFPFPSGAENDASLESAGHAYYGYRAKLMIDINLGLTKTYNRFCDPNDQRADIVELRRLHDAMDRAVLDAYGWTDLKPEPVFEREWEAEEGEKPGPWRYRWPEAMRDEVLARLLALNAQRAAQEQALGLTAGGKGKRGRKPRGAAAPGAPAAGAQLALAEADKEEDR